VQENMRYARRQLTWFKKEPDVHWITGPGESAAAIDAAAALVAEHMHNAPHSL
jgi:tRNA dimethylallyltransferase